MVFTKSQLSVAILREDKPLIYLNEDVGTFLGSCMMGQPML